MYAQADTVVEKAIRDGSPMMKRSKTTSMTPIPHEEDPSNSSLKDTVAGDSDAEEPEKVKMFLGSFDDLNKKPRRSSPGGENVCMYDEDEDLDKASMHSTRSFRRASMGGLPSEKTYIRRSLVSNDDDERSIHSTRSSRARRASLNGPIPASMLGGLGPSDGYGTDDDDDDIGVSQHSLRRRASMSRRGSAGFGALPPGRVHDDPYGPPQPVKRRTSAGNNPRRVSPNYNAEKLEGAGTNASRRRSGGFGTEHRGSTGFETGGTLLEYATRRASAGSINNSRYESVDTEAGPVNLQGRRGYVGSSSRRGPISNGPSETATRMGSTAGGLLHQGGHRGHDGNTSRRGPISGVPQEHLMATQRKIFARTPVTRNDTTNSVELARGRRASAELDRNAFARGAPPRTTTADSMELAPGRRALTTSSEKSQFVRGLPARSTTADSMELAPGRRTVRVSPDHVGFSEEPMLRSQATDSIELTPGGRASLAMDKSVRIPVMRTNTANSMDLIPGRRGVKDSLTEETEMMYEQVNTDRQMPPSRSAALRRGRRVSSGFNESALDRMNQAASCDNHNEESEESEPDYGYGDGMAHPYGYSADNYLSRRESTASQVSSNAVMSRRGSNYSQSSGIVSRRGSNYSQLSAQRTRRRNSYLVRPERDFNMADELLDSALRMSDSDLSEDEQKTFSKDVPKAFYNYNGEQSLNTQSAFGYDSDAQSMSSADSQNSSKSHCRNSYLVRPEQDAAFASSLLAATPRMCERLVATEHASIEEHLTEDDQSEEEEEDFKNPDSLLSRSGYLKVHGTQHHSRLLEAAVEVELKELKDGEHENDQPMRSVPIAAGQSSGTLVGARLQPTNEQVKHQPQNESKEKDAWNRRTPFTTSLAESLTADKINELQKIQPKISTENIPKQYMRSCKMNWGELTLESSDESSENYSESRFGSRLYEDSPSNQELDGYKQRARRRESIERTVLNIEKSASSSLLQGKNNPDFKPATGCVNASDFIVRCFSARLRMGITVLKHNRSRWSKSSNRDLVLLDGRTLSWKPVGGEQDKGKRPRLDISKCREVRHAWSRDPLTRKQTGTITLRKRCKDGMASKSFSLIFGKRTLDITAMTNDQCKVLMEGFSALCYRLQLEQLEEGDTHSESRAARGGDSKSMTTDDDWNSTVFGDSTMSLTQSNTTGRTLPIPASPWGL